MLIQNLHPQIKFTMEQSFKELPFLDILIKNLNCKITTDIYHKPTDIKQYLHFQSHHPKNYIKSIPNALACRICTIVINKNFHQIHLKSGYPTTLINKGFELIQVLLRAGVKGNRKLILVLIQERTLLLVSGRIESSAFSLFLSSCSFSRFLPRSPSFLLSLSPSGSRLPSFLPWDVTRSSGKCTQNKSFISCN